MQVSHPVCTAWDEQAMQTMDKLQAWGQFKGPQLRISVVLAAPRVCMDCRCEPVMQATDERVVMVGGTRAVRQRDHL